MSTEYCTYTHGCKDNGKVVSTVVHHIFGLLHQASLATYLGSNLETRSLNQEQIEETLKKQFIHTHFEGSSDYVHV